MPFIGKQGSTGNSKIKKHVFTADASQTAFSVSSDASDELQVFLNGVLLKETDDYTYTTSTVTLGSPALLNDIVEVHVYQSFLIANAVRETGDTMTGELEVPTVKLSSNVIKASDGGSTITLDTSDNVTIGGDLKVTNVKHESSGSNNLVLGSDGTTTVSGALTASGGIANAGTISAGTIGTSVTFPTRSDLGIIEIFGAGDPLITHNAHQDFSYTSGQPYFVMCNLNGGNNSSQWEYYNITTSNTVSQMKNWTDLIQPSIPSNGTLRISVANNSDRDVWSVLLVRMNH